MSAGGEHRDSAEVLRRALERERASREEAEGLLESKSRELFEANERLAERADRSDEALRVSLSTLRFALAAASMGVWTWWREDDRVELDAGLARMLGLGEGRTFMPFAEWIGRVSPANAGVFDGLSEGQPFAIELGFRDGAGATRTLALRGGAPDHPLAGGDRLVGVVRDVTDQRREERAARARAAVRARTSRVASLGEMASSLAHELNQPLGALATYTSVIARRLDALGVRDQPAEEACARVVALSGRASEIVRGIRSLLQRAPAERVSASVADLLDHALEAADIGHTWPGVELGVSAPGELVAWCDPVLIEQVIVNLVRNAAEAASEGGDVPARVRVSAHADGDAVRIDVIDSGAGLPSAIDPEQVFEPFFTTRTEGIGLGLAISRSVVEANGGRIGCEQLERGTRFWFTIPAREGEA